MKNTVIRAKLFAFTGIFALPVYLLAQQAPIQYFRYNDQAGLHVFETTKNDTNIFTGIKVRVGGNFTQDFQVLDHSNDATPVYADGINSNRLASLKPGFNLAMANLNIDAQLADGVRMNLTVYLSARHHPEAWVKGGYVQLDKLPFFKSYVIDNIMKSFTIKIGSYEVDYGDQHFRRSDGGNSIYNPFTENYIMDEFTTEIGGEIYYHPSNGIIVMAGITNGQLNPTVIASSKTDSATGKLNKYPPAFHGKLGYDKQLNNNLRLRLTGSVYAIKSGSSNTLFFGDRTGSHYFYVMENSTASAVANAWSGRFNPQFSQQVFTCMINPFIKYKGVELFGTFEVAQGRMITEKNMRMATQYATDVIYRFPREKENFWIGARYNVLNAEIVSQPNDITINRAVGSAGWFVTRNLMMKAEYVTQQYHHFQSADIRSGGRYDGFMVEASIAF